MSKVYLITANTYDDSYGIEISCYGIATNEETLKLIVNKVKEDGYCEEITEIETDTFIDEYLGGYYE